MTRELHKPLPRSWWLRRATYFQFMTRELTSLAVLAYALLMVWALLSSSGDAGSFPGFFEFLTSGTSVWLHILLLVLALFHTGTWIALTPKVLVLWRDDERIEPDVIAGANSVLFLVVSGVVLWLVMG
jgi:fumarate reductase subunit C